MTTRGSAPTGPAATPQAKQLLVEVRLEGLDAATRFTRAFRREPIIGLLTEHGCMIATSTFAAKTRRPSPLRRCHIWTYPNYGTVLDYETWRIYESTQ